MKKFMTILFVMALMAVPAWPTSAQDRGRERDRDDWANDLPERDEFRKTFELSSGSRVELSGINGSVDIETSDTTVAEVHVVRSARKREDLEFQKIIVEQTAEGLIVRGEKDKRRNRDEWGGHREVRQRVSMKIPRNVNFAANGINGRVRAGEIDGTLDINGVNGSVTVEQAIGYARINGVNGRVNVMIAQLSDRGIDVHGINGGVELRFRDDLHADLDVSGCNGSVYPDVPNVTMMGKISRDNFRAKIGAGGPRITVSGVNGRVRLTRGGSAQ